MHELKRKMMLTLFGLLSALSLLLVGIFDAYDYETTRQDLQSNLTKLSDAFFAMQNSQFGPWAGGRQDDIDSISLIYENPVWMVSFDFSGQIRNVFATDPDELEADEIVKRVEEVRLEHQPSQAMIGDPLTDSWLYLYPSGQQMIAVRIDSVRKTLLTGLGVSVAIFAVFEGVLYLVCRRLTKWMIGPIEESLEKQKQFIADASHELKTPVAVIQANAEAMENDPDEKWLKNIQNETVRMSGLITDLLDLARSDAQPIVREKTDFSKAVLKQTMIQEARIFENHLTLEEDIDPDIYVLGQASMLEQLAAILIDNAIAHSSGKIRVSLHASGKEARFCVSNTGMPIPPEIREKIFERFYRADSARERSSGRYGLGLAIAKSLTQKHEGTIEVRCEEGWTSFEVVLRRIPS